MIASMSAYSTEQVARDQAISLLIFALLALSNEELAELLNTVTDFRNPGTRLPILTNYLVR